MRKLKIEEFVEQHYGIKLTKAQLEMIAMMATKTEEKFVIEGGRQAGKTTAYKAAMGYLQDGMKPVELINGTSIDFGELLLKTATNAEHLNNNMQNTIARYMDYQSTPKMYMKNVERELGI